LVRRLGIRAYDNKEQMEGVLMVRYSTGTSIYFRIFMLRICKVRVTCTIWQKSTDPQKEKDKPGSKTRPILQVRVYCFCCAG